MSRYTEFIKKMYNRVPGRTPKEKIKKLAKKWGKEKKKFTHRKSAFKSRQKIHFRTDRVRYIGATTRQRAKEQKEKKAERLAEKERYRLETKLFYGSGKLTKRERHRLERINRKYPEPFP